MGPSDYRSVTLQRTINELLLNDFKLLAFNRDATVRKIFTDGLQPSFVAIVMPFLAAAGQYRTACVRHLINH
jgi:hypothetical protein